jgi:polyisoprenoid-binding protein YceI
VRAKTSTLALALIALATSVAPASGQESRWVVDTSRSTASFATNHLFLTRVIGTIPIRNATLVIPGDSAIPTSVEAALDPAGISTADAARDANLRSANFLDVARFPEITFVSTSVTRLDASHFTIAGTLSIIGVTRPVTLFASYVGEEGSGASLRLTYEAHATIDRTQWGMTYGQPVVGTSLAIALKIVAMRAS